MKRLIFITVFLPIFTSSVGACDICLREYLKEEIREAKEVQAICDDLEYEYIWSEFYYYLDGTIEANENTLKQMDRPCKLEP
jgi:hypothetical protein